MEIEAKMADDKRREEERIREEEEVKLVKRPGVAAKAKAGVTTSGEVVKPVRKRFGRGF
jgi:pre-mRNA-splicing factor ATP-dependent RNA helicase DHX38/PRP16